MKLFNILSNKIVSLLIGISLLIYVTVTLISQANTINDSEQLLEVYKDGIEEQKIINRELEAEHQSVGSDEFIEKIARQRLGLCKSTEKLFVNGKSE
jgi:cell division protein FtsB